MKSLLEKPGCFERRRFRVSPRARRGLKQIICIALLVTTALAQEQKKDLTELNLEDLMNIEVTSVSKREEKLFQTAAAVFVINQDDIRHSGATSVPDLLRMVPGLEVAQIDASHWAISSRGFNSQFANKMLVLIDGRSVYAPLFSGVFWDTQDLMLEDIERIEVIRGPGATVWGANAVNGVINIITRRSEETQGGLMVTGAGTEERGFGSLRYGGRMGKEAYYRVYAKYFNRDNLVDLSGGKTVDSWDALRGGLRIDWKAGSRDSLTVQGDIYQSDVNQRQIVVSLAPPYVDFPIDRSRVSGGNVLSRWTRAFSDRSQTSLQFYYDRTRRDELIYSETRDTLDFDLQHHINLNRRHDVVWGVGYRRTKSDFENSPSVLISSKTKADNLLSGFIQDEITLIKDKIRLTIGSKFEHNDYTGFEIQPSLRALWTPGAKHTLWGAVSQAVRTPARAETDSVTRISAFPGEGGLANVVVAIGNRNFQSEVLLAYEIGYRAQPNKRLFLDVASFYNDYDRIRSAEPKSPFLETAPQPHVVIPLFLENKTKGRAYGIETWANLQATSYWKLAAGYTWLRINLRRAEGGLDTAGLTQAQDVPNHQFQIMSNFNFPRGFEFDTMLYYVGRVSNQNTPDYTRLDARLGWQATEKLSLSFAAQNLLDARHKEFGNTILTPSNQVQRSVYGKITWRF